MSVEAGLMQMLTMMETGKFKVFSSLLDWFEEFRLYHRKDGKVVKEGDDLLAATRYGVMMLRFAEMIYRKRERWPRRPTAPGPLMDELCRWGGVAKPPGVDKPHGCTAAGNARRQPQKPLACHSRRLSKYIEKRGTTRRQKANGQDVGDHP